MTFVDEFLTLEFCQRHQLFSFGLNEGSGYFEIESRKFEEVKSQLLANLTNFGRPMIDVIDGNYHNRGELYLRHTYQGAELKLDDAEDTLRSLHVLWGRPVHVETVLDEEPVVLSFDGAECRSSNRK